MKPTEIILWTPHSNQHHHTSPKPLAPVRWERSKVTYTSPFSLFHRNLLTSSAIRPLHCIRNHKQITRVDIRQVGRRAQLDLPTEGGLNLLKIQFHRSNTTKVTLGRQNELARAVISFTQVTTLTKGCHHRHIKTLVAVDLIGAVVGLTQVTTLTDGRVWDGNLDGVVSVGHKEVGVPVDIVVR